MKFLDDYDKFLSWLNWLSTFVVHDTQSHFTNIKPFQFAGKVGQWLTDILVVKFDFCFSSLLVKARVLDSMPSRPLYQMKGQYKLQNPHGRSPVNGVIVSYWTMRDTQGWTSNREWDVSEWGWLQLTLLHGTWRWVQLQTCWCFDKLHAHNLAHTSSICDT